MNKSNMKNMIIIKDLPSNIVEEAIVILKSNIKMKSLGLAETKKENRNNEIQSKFNSKKYIVNEAELIINNYLSSLEKQKKRGIKINKELESKYKRLKIISFFLSALLIFSFLI